MSAISNFCEYFVDLREDEEILKDYYPSKPKAGTDELKKYEALKDTIDSCKYQKAQLICNLANIVFATIGLSFYNFKFVNTSHMNAFLCGFGGASVVLAAYRIVRISALYFLIS